MKRILKFFKIVVYILVFPFWLILWPLFSYFNCDEYFITGYIEGYSDCKNELDMDYHRHDIKEHLQKEYLWFAILVFIAYSVALIYFTYKYF